jgi:DNA-binding NtrC family response regulator
MGKLGRGESVSNKVKLSRIFVVDDEFVIATTLATILERSGFDATSFTDPMKVLKAAAAGAPDLLISDVVMPEMSGIDLAIRLKQDHPECKILLFSGQAATANLLDVARQKGHDFEVLSKPIHPTEFLKKIRDVTETVDR